jgi:hypothetical protein
MMDETTRALGVFVALFSEVTLVALPIVVVPGVADQSTIRSVEAQPCVEAGGLDTPGCPRVSPVSASPSVSVVRFNSSEPIGNAPTSAHCVDSVRDKTNKSFLCYYRDRSSLFVESGAVQPPESVETTICRRDSLFFFFFPPLQ